MPYKDQQSPEAKASQARRNKAYYEKHRHDKIEINVHETKICSMCKKEKSWTEYYPRKDRSGGITAGCKECLKVSRDKYKDRAKEVRRWRDFKITPKEYNTMFLEQEGKCCICGKEEHEMQQNSLCVDHCHKTDKVRGLLCHSCNVGLGRFKDNIEYLKNAINYLTI